MGTDNGRPSFTEKRKHPRQPTTLEYKIENIGETFDIEGITRNLSANGVLCQVDKPIPEMTELKLLLKLPNDYAECQGTVVRVKKCVGSEEKYHIAIYFNKIAPAEKKKITDFIGQ
jgi:hypothetical protein